MLLVVLAAAAVGASQPRFSEPTALPQMGLLVRLPENAREVPLPAPRIYTFEVTAPTGKRLVDWYKPRDLWVESQHGGRWVDAHSNSLVLASIRHPLPPEGPRPHVSRDAFKRAAYATSLSHAGWTHKGLSTWVENFTGQSVTAVAAVAGAPNRLSDLVRFRTADPRQLLYAFRFAELPNGSVLSVRPWYLAWLTVGRRTDAEGAARQLRRWFFTYLTCVSRPWTGRESPSSVFQAHRGATARQRPAGYRASRDRVLAGIRNLKDWWHVETPHYIILSNLGRRHRNLVKELQRDLEHMRNAYEKTLPPRVLIDAVGVVRVFASGEEYLAYVDAEHRWTTGLWIGDRQELVIRPPDETGGRADAAYLRTAYHEAFHQYITYALDRIETAAWFNEGHAAYFGAADVGLRRVAFIEDSRRTRVLEAALRENAVDLAALLKLSYPDFYVSAEKADQEQRERHYALAWGLVYYLRKGVPLERKSPFKGLLDRYVEVLWQTRNPEAATAAILKEYDITQLSSDLTKFWQSPRKRATAKRHDPLR